MSAETPNEPDWWSALEHTGAEAAPHVGVVGAARSGLAAARLLLDRGARVTLLDLQIPAQRRDEIAELRARGVEVRWGEHDPAWVDEFDLIIKSPGVPPEIPFLRVARSRGPTVAGEIELAARLARGPALAVTGTNGKSTTTAWLGDMLRRAGRAPEVCGNIGRPFAEAVRHRPDAVFVVEVSSFQLEDASTFAPRIAVLTNFGPDHLDRHSDLETYREAKLSMFRRLEDEGAAVFGEDDELVRRAGVDADRIWRFRLTDRGEPGCFIRGGRLWARPQDGPEEPLLPPAGVSLPGAHNLENGLAAATAALAFGVSAQSIRESLAGFAGLPHRLERVGEIDGVLFVNDSKATNLGSLRVALQAYAGRPLVLLAGGLGKGQDFGELRAEVAAQVGHLVLFGRDAERIEEAWDGVPAHRAETLPAAVARARELCPGGGVVLLSPGCASFDMFENFEARGDAFRAAVRELGGSSPQAGRERGAPRDA